MGRELSGNVTLTPGWSDRMVKQFFKFVSGKHDCHIRRCKTTEVVVGTETQDSHGHA